MVKRSLHVYIEGGGDSRIQNDQFRKAWGIFLKELHDLARSTGGGLQGLTIVRCKGRSNAYRRFCAHKEVYPNEPAVLLVDAEGVIGSETSVWNFVANRRGDEWQRPSWAEERNLYLMVASVETWIVSDPAALIRYFGNCFNAHVLPVTELENRSKEDIARVLEHATRDCRNSRGRYKHGDGNTIIGYVDPSKVKALPHGNRLFAGLRDLILENGS
jgi:hypothetical protein